MKLSVLASLASLAAFAFAVPNPLPGSSNVVVRDPAIWYNAASKKYFVFSTGTGIQIFTSISLLGPWTNVGSVLPNCTVIDIAPPGNCGLWAPDVNFVDGQYVLYYSVSSLGSQNSAIGVATSPSMEPGTWTDHGAVVRSSTGAEYNAIDPNLVIDYNGQLKLGFGSYWDGIFQIALSSITAQAEAPPGTHLAGYSGRAAEGGFTYKPPSSPYWFEFFSDGITPLQGRTTTGDVPPSRRARVQGARRARPERLGAVRRPAGQRHHAEPHAAHGLARARLARQCVRAGRPERVSRPGERAGRDGVPLRAERRVRGPFVPRHQLSRLFERVAGRRGLTRCRGRAKVALYVESVYDGV